MALTREILEALIFKNYDRTIVRFLQSSPIYPAVWLAYAEADYSLETFRLDLILTPDAKSSAAELFQALNGFKRQEATDESWDLATNGETVAAKLTFKELIEFALPLSSWWANLWAEQKKQYREQEWLWMVIGAVVATRLKFEINKLDNDEREILSETGSDYLGAFDTKRMYNASGILWSVNLNRQAFLSLQYSVPCTKADAGRRLFNIDGSDITCAILDTGVDAGHPAFRKIDPKTKQFYDMALGKEDDPSSNHSRVVATYNFVLFRELVSQLTNGNNSRTLLTNLPTGDKYDKPLSELRATESITQIKMALEEGRMLDWSVLGPLLRIPHNQSRYQPPLHPHGTHVAGIIGAGMTEDVSTTVLVGMCPRINIYDFRVLDANGNGDEFNIIAALQFIRWINQHQGLDIHCVNLSMSLLHDVETYACGQTPVCISVNQLAEEGVVVVAASGNQGQAMYQSDKGQLSQGFRTVNITDPGNADGAITVGATHRNKPHQYGVSYFSSKGPTGDGRIKPDLVAPGEKIISAVLDNGMDSMDGTSMAAPHVTGAAALIMSKHRELIGRPRKIKEILCSTATDLGRERYFQGHGMVDVLRAIQAV